ncbi:MAG: ribonuclease P protein component [Chlamydiia bacterium]|nr:ribonuclease P protein component [Chlamydiia bacterium]
MGISKISSLSFPKSARILKNAHYRHVVNFGHKRVGRFLMVHYQWQGRGGGPRIGITVSRKFGNAVERNLFKRRVREVFRHIRRNLPSDLRCVVKPRPMATKVAFSDIKTELTYLLRETV